MILHFSLQPSTPFQTQSRPPRRLTHFLLSTATVMEALLASSSQMMLVPLGSSSVIEVHDGTRTMSDLPTKNFRKYVQRVWNTFDLIPHWSGAKPDMEAMAHHITEGQFSKLPPPFGFKSPAPVKHMHLILIPKHDEPGAFSIVKYVTFTQAIGHKTLGAICYGEPKQFDSPDSGARAKGARVALHRLFMSINGFHITNFDVKESAEDDKDADSKTKLVSDEDIDAAFDLIRQDSCNLIP